MDDALFACEALVGVQAQENPLESLPAGPWPASLETLFVHSFSKVARPTSHTYHLPTSSESLPISLSSLSSTVSTATL